MSDGTSRIRTALLELLPAEQTLVPRSLTEMFAAELDQYAELIVGPGGRPVGFMTRGEGPMFTERVRLALEQLDLPAAARAHHQALAQWFEHKRGFFKAEWHSAGPGLPLEPLAAIYFRRRPPVEAVLERLDGWGVPAAVASAAAELGAILEKETIHFVSAAFRPGHPVHHKLYFSQWVTAETREAVTARLIRVFEYYGFGPAAIAAWKDHHERCVLPHDSTLFVSMSCAADGVSRSFKIDYPDLSSALAAGWLPEPERAAVRRDGDLAQAMTGTRLMSFLGVRFTPDLDEPERLTPALKYYCDVPTPIQIAESPGR